MCAQHFRGAAESQYEGQAASAGPPGKKEPLHWLLKHFCSRPPWWWQWTGRSSSPAPSPASAKDAGQCSRECQLTRLDIRRHTNGMVEAFKLIFPGG